MMIAETALLVVLLAALVALATVDHRHNRLPDCFTLPLLWLGLFANTYSVFIELSDAVIGAIAGYLCIRIAHDLRVLLSSSPGIGLGDAKLLAALGAWQGWQPLPFIVIVAGVVTLVFYFRRIEKPFGVGLATAMIGLCLVAYLPRISLTVYQ